MFCGFEELKVEGEESRDLDGEENRRNKPLNSQPNPPSPTASID